MPPGLFKLTGCCAGRFTELVGNPAMAPNPRRFAAPGRRTPTASSSRRPWFLPWASCRRSSIRVPCRALESPPRVMNTADLTAERGSCDARYQQPATDLHLSVTPGRAGPRPPGSPPIAASSARQEPWHQPGGWRIWAVEELPESTGSGGGTVPQRQPGPTRADAMLGGWPARRDPPARSRPSPLARPQRSADPRHASGGRRGDGRLARS
jgi:hypothetical protein